MASPKNRLSNRVASLMQTSASAEQEARNSTEPDDPVTREPENPRVTETEITTSLEPENPRSTGVQEARALEIQNPRARGVKNPRVIETEGQLVRTATATHGEQWTGRIVQMNFELPEDMRTAFRIRTLTRGTDASKVLRQLIEQWMSEP